MFERGKALFASGSLRTVRERIFAMLVTPQCLSVRDRGSGEHRFCVPLAWEGLFTANLRAKMMDFQRVLLNRNLNCKGWNSHVHGDFPGSFESINLSRDKLSSNLSREVGRNRFYISWSADQGGIAIELCA